MNEHERGRQTKLSKTLSHWLRHRPEAGGLTLDAGGWVPLAELLAALGRVFQPPVSEAELRAVIAESDKQRFALQDGRVRANQGHSFPVALGLVAVAPPDLLYHGTTRERWRQIARSGGLRPMGRQHVHLSPDVATARRVAERHRAETPLVLRVDAAALADAGHAVYRSENGVYLTDAVPIAFLNACEQA